MMRKILWLTGALMLPITAHGQVITDSPAEDIANLKSYLQELKAWVVQNTQVLHEAATDLNTANTYAQEVQTYLAFVENPTLANFMGIVNSAGLGSDMPINPLQVMSLANGFNSMQANGSLTAELGQLRMLSGFASGAFGANHVYTCTATDAACTDINARSNGIAGSMGMTQTAYADLQAHKAMAAALRADLVGETDPAKRETIIAQIGTEQLYIATIQASNTAAAQQANLAQQSAEQRIIERQRQSADAWFDDTQPITNAASVAANTGQPDALPPLFTAN